MHIKNRNGLAGWRKRRKSGIEAGTSPADTGSVKRIIGAEAGPADTGSINSSVNSGAAPASDLERLYSAILDREGFTYDASADPAYRQYREAYTASGKRAMADAEARAAALTGGYGSTYSAAVGQQEYDEYMKKLADTVPELERTAYDRYRAEGDALIDAYALAADREQTEYDRASDEYDRLEAERTYRQKLADAEYARELDAAKSAYNAQKDERTMLTALIGKGYTPTDQELSAAGMTRAQANSLLYEYYRSSKQTAPAWLTDALGIEPAAKSTAGGSAALNRVKATAAQLREAGADDETVNTYISRQATAGLITVADARKLMKIGK